MKTSLFLLSTSVPHSRVANSECVLVGKCLSDVIKTELIILLVQNNFDDLIDETRKYAFVSIFIA